MAIDMSSPRHARRDRTRAQRLLEDISATIGAMESGGASIGDLKIVARALDEMRAAFAMFAPYRGVRKVATCVAENEAHGASNLDHLPARKVVGCVLVRRRQALERRRVRRLRVA